MSFRLYDILEETLKNLHDWKENDSISKEDVLDSLKSRIVTLMTHVITTPMIGTAFAYPGDIPDLVTWANE